MRIKTLVNGPFGTNCYIVQEDDTCILIDAPYPAKPLISALENENLTPSMVCLTHGHFDHVLALAELKAHYPALKVAISEPDAFYLQKGEEGCLSDIHSFGTSLLRAFPSSCFDFPKVDILLNEETALLGKLRVVTTPGHTQGSVCFIDENERVIFSGDTLFYESVGRTDLRFGSQETLKKSLEKIKKMEGDYVILPGHGTSTTLSHERARNPYLF